MARALQFRVLQSAIEFIKTTASQDPRKLSASVHASASLQHTVHQKCKSIAGENWTCKHNLDLVTIISLHVFNVNPLGKIKVKPQHVYLNSSMGLKIG